MTTRKRPSRPVHGWLVLDKPKGVTSTAAVGRVRRFFGAAKAGHGGTLDPLATGVLPIALGEATKTVAFEMEGTKIYRFTVRWGEERSTDDAEGAVTAVSPRRPAESEIRAVLPEFIGNLQQVPPAYSAVKVKGKRAYDLARAEICVTLAPRTVVVEDMTLVAVPDLDHATFVVRCGRGTYMRALARDLGRRLGTAAYIAELRRLAAGPFTEDQAIPLDSLETLGHSAAAQTRLLPVETALDDIPALALSEAEARSLRSGQSVPLLRAADADRVQGIAPGTRVCAMAGGKPVAVALFDEGRLKPVRVFNL
ncbi:MAG: tRNA pseudouridine(55) synthase TruB [Alphaproteobacteria bacterium]